MHASSSHQGLRWYSQNLFKPDEMETTGIQFTSSPDGGTPRVFKRKRDTKAESRGKETLYDTAQSLRGRVISCPLGKGPTIGSMSRPRVPGASTGLMHASRILGTSLRKTGKTSAGQSGAKGKEALRPRNAPVVSPEEILTRENRPSQARRGRVIEFNSFEPVREQGTHQAPEKSDNTARCSPQQPLESLHEQSDGVQEASASPLSAFSSNRRVARDHHLKAKLSEADIIELVREPCCSKFCCALLGKSTLRFVRKIWFSQSVREQNLSLKQMNVFNASTKQWAFLVDGREVCVRAFRKVLGLGPKRISKCRLSGTADPSPLSPSGRTPSEGRLSIKVWLDDFFKRHCDIMPDRERQHLPAHFTKLSVFSILQADDRMTNAISTLSLTQFKSVWLQSFPNVKIPATNRFAACAQCEHFKALRQKAETLEEKERGRIGLQRHLKHQDDERTKSKKHRKKSEDHPHKYLQLVMDGMDQSKTNLPHWFRVPKSADPSYFIHVHLVGVHIFCGTFKSRVFLNYPNHRNDANLTIFIIQTIINEWEGPLPPVLYLQLDNTARENKNNLLMSYLHFLVYTKVFRKVKINFLIVGHTHDRIDQMFSKISQALAKNKAFTLDSFIKVVHESYSPTPTISVVDSIPDFRRYALSDPKIVINNIRNLSFSHQFRIKLNTSNSVVPSQWSKKVSSDVSWEPIGGVNFLKESFPSGPIYEARGLPLRKRGEKMPLVSKTNSDSPFSHEDMEIFLVDIENHIFSLSNLFASTDITWWKKFFEEQRHFNKHLLEPLPLVANFFNMRGREWTEAAGVSFNHVPTIDPADLDLELLGERREIYVGNYKNPARVVEEREKMTGDFKDLEVGSMICVEAENCPDGRPFWIAQVQRVGVMLEDDTPDQIFIRWFACDKNEDDPYIAKYHEEYQVDDRSKRSQRRSVGTSRLKTATRMQELYLSKTTVLSYNFSLSVAKRLRRDTIEIIRSRLEV